MIIGRGVGWSSPALLSSIIHECLCKASLILLTVMIANLQSQHGDKSFACILSDTMVF